MDVPFKLYAIEIRKGLQGDKRQSSMFSQQTGVVGCLHLLNILHLIWLLSPIQLH